MREGERGEGTPPNALALFSEYQFLHLLSGVNLIFVCFPRKVISRMRENAGWERDCGVCRGHQQTR